MFFVDGKKTARVDQHLSQLIKGNSEFTIPLEVQLNFKKLDCWTLSLACLEEKNTRCGSKER